MYRVFKPKGAGTSITVENSDSNASIMIGKFNLEVLNILKDSLKENGIEPPGYREEWYLEVNKDVATKLMALTMPMKKPIRNQRRKEEPKKTNKEVDAMDVLLGLADYN